MFNNKMIQIQKVASNWRKYTPNVLTMMRVILSLIIVTLIFVSHFNNQTGIINFYENPASKEVICWITAGFLFCLGAFFDWLDGYLSRKWRVESTFGKFMDPIADKILINLTALVLAVYYWKMFPLWVLLIFLVRDYLIDGIRFVLAKEYQITLSANMLGKIKTTLQLVAMIIIFFALPFFATPWIMQIWLIPLYMAAIISVISGAIYLLNAYSTIKSNKVK